MIKPKVVVRYKNILVSKWLKRNINILHISDLHFGSHIGKLVDVWGTVKGLTFDLVAITGDIVLHSVKELLPHILEIKKLAEKVPVFFVQGNHDYMDYLEIKKTLEGAGVTVLENERKTVCVLGNEIDVYGTLDYYYLKDNGFDDVYSLLEHLKKERLSLVLTHQPQIIDLILKFKPDLVLSGHTHGGQVRLPFFPTLYAPGQGALPKYGDWLYKLGKTNLYISRGVATTVFPFRFFNPPEISVLTVCGGL